MILGESVYLKGASTFFKGELDYMWIDVSRNYLVTTGLVSISPRKAISNPVHYIELDDGVISVRLPKSTVWITHDCRKEVDGLWWTILGKEYFWEYLDSDQVPEWALEVFTRGVAQLEKYPV